MKSPQHPFNSRRVRLLFAVALSLLSAPQAVLGQAAAPGAAPGTKPAAPGGLPLPNRGAAPPTPGLRFPGPPGAGEADAGPSLELVDPKFLRVCSDPNNLPFSNQKGEGFENKIADLIGKKLGKKVSYDYFPMATGFVRKTLNSYKCDVIIGYPQGGDIAQPTLPYYRTAYSLVFKKGSELEGVTTLEDPKLRGKKIGIVAGTPPGNNMAVNGLLANARPYPLMIDTRVDSSSNDMIKDLKNGLIDVGILWGPMAGYFAKRADPPLVVTPLVKEKTGPALAYYIAMGVRPSDSEWKRKLDKLILANQADINKILLEFGVPLIDANNAPVTAATVSNRP